MHPFTMRKAAARASLRMRPFACMLSLSIQARGALSTCLHSPPFYACESNHALHPFTMRKAAVRAQESLQRGGPYRRAGRRGPSSRPRRCRPMSSPPARTSRSASRSRIAGASFGRGATAIWQCTECIQQQIQYSAHSTSTRAQGPLRWNLQGCMVRSSFFRGVLSMIRLARTN